MGLKGKIEAIIYAAEEPITLEQVSFLMKEPVLQELSVEKERAAAEAAELAAQQTTEREQNGEQAKIEVAPEPEPEPASEPAVEELPVSVPEEPVQETSPAPETASEEIPGEDPAGEAWENAKPAVAPKRKKNEVPPEVKARVRALIQELTDDYANNDRGMEIRQLAGGYRMATKPEHHDIIKAFVKSLKPPLRLSLPALETLAVVAYKQPVTAPEVSEIRGVDSQGVMATLLERKLVTTAGRKAVIGRPILYKTTKEFLLRFGMNEVSELPSMEEFEKLAQKEFFSPEAEDEETAPATGHDLELTGEDSEGELADVGESASEQAQVERGQAADSAEPQSEPEQETVKQNLSDTQPPE
jgi:segregation and condensation protein B